MAKPSSKAAFKLNEEEFQKFIKKPLVKVGKSLRRFVVLEHPIDDSLHVSFYSTRTCPPRWGMKS